MAEKKPRFEARIYHHGKRKTTHVWGVFDTKHSCWPGRTRELGPVQQLTDEETALNEVDRLNKEFSS